MRAVTIELVARTCISSRFPGVLKSLFLFRHHFECIDEWQVIGWWGGTSLSLSDLPLLKSILTSLLLTASFQVAGSLQPNLL